MSSGAVAARRVLMSWSKRISLLPCQKNNFRGLLARRCPPEGTSLKVIDHEGLPQVFCLVGVSVMDSTRKRVSSPAVSLTS